MNDQQKKMMIVGGLIVLLGSCGWFVQGPANAQMIEPERTYVGDSSLHWTGVDGSEKKLLSTHVQPPVCLGGVEYLHVTKSFMGGITPRYRQGELVTCDTERHPDMGGPYSFFRICHDDNLYYQYTRLKGTMMTVALAPSGVPMPCDGEEPPVG